MGSEASCEAALGRQSSKGTAYLETDELLFRGEFRVRVPLREIQSVKAKNGVLEIGFGDELLRLRLGEKAATWASKIEKPKGRIEKLGLKPDRKIVVTGIADPAFLKELGEAGVQASSTLGKNAFDVLVLGIESRSGLAALDRAKAGMADGGAIWIVYPKGRPDPREADVIEAGRRAGLVGTKVARFSETHTALRFSRRKS